MGWGGVALAEQRQQNRRVGSVKPAGVPTTTNQLGEELSSSIMASEKLVIKSLDMSPEMKDEAIKVCKEVLGQNLKERDIAKHIKQHFDARYQPTWHCVVGKSFGSYVTHETNHFIYFTMEGIAVLLFKSG